MSKTKEKIISEIENAIDSAMSTTQGLMDYLNSKEDENPYSEKSTAELLEASKPLIKYLAENHHPHVMAKVTANSVELLEGCMSHQNVNEYLVD